MVRTPSQTAGAIRARKFRELHRDDPDYRRRNAERSARLRKAAGAKSRARWQPSSTTTVGQHSVAQGAPAASNESNSQRSTSGSDVATWDDNVLPELHLPPGTELPTALIQRLKMVDIRLRTLLSSTPLAEDLALALRDPPLAATALLERTHGRISSGTHIDYCAVRFAIRMSRAVTDALRPAIADADSATSLCPPSCYQAFGDFRLLLKNAMTALDLAIINMKQALLAFPVTPTFLKEAVTSSAKHHAQSCTQRSELSTGIKLRPEQVNCLCPGVWLCDTVIDFLSETWNMSCVLDDCVILPVDFSFRCIKDQTSKAVDILRKVSLRQPRRTEFWPRIVIPISHNNHFFVLHIDSDARISTAFDSLASHAWSQQQLTVLNQAFAALHRKNRFLTVHLQQALTAINTFCEGKGWDTVEEDDWNDISQGFNVPQQSNSVDCGVYTLLFIRHLIRSSAGTLKDKSVPTRYQFPGDQTNPGADRTRLIFLEEIEEISGIRPTGC